MVASRETGPRPRADPPDLRQARDRPCPVDHPRRPRQFQTSKPVAFLLADLGVTQSHSRPHVSNDNPFSEAQFKTLKYRPDFPERFSFDRRRPAPLPSLLPLVQRRTSPTGLGLHSRRRPLRTGRGRPDKRAGVLRAAYAAHPERFGSKTARTTENARRRVDQPTRPTRGEHSLNTAQRCLIQVDRFRRGR